MAKEGKDSTPERVVQDIRRKTRRRSPAEEKTRIVLEGLRGEESIATRDATAGARASLRPVLRLGAKDVQEQLTE